MRSPRKAITGAQAKSLAHLALNGIIERTSPQPRELCVSFRTVYVAGHPKSNVFIGRDGGMRSRLAHDHPVRRLATLNSRITKIVPSHLRDLTWDGLNDVRPDVAAEVSRLYDAYERTGVAA